MEWLVRIAAQLEQGQAPAVAEATAAAIAAGVPTGRILDEGLIAGMDRVGERFRTREIFLPHVLLAARAMHAGLELLKPLLVRDDVPRAGRVVLGTVRGDQHDIGKNLVGIMLEGAGFEVVDLGIDVEPAAFVAAAREHAAAVIGMSALLTTTMPVMAEVVDLVDAAGLRGQVRTVVGGAPVTEAWARTIGADGYAYDGVSAVARVRRLVSGAPGLQDAP
jgi:5-methyltetrahydrofolate--homocysteine methyltransferase